MESLRTRGPLSGNGNNGTGASPRGRTEGRARVPASFPFNSEMYEQFLESSGRGDELQAEAVDKDRLKERATGLKRAVDAFASDSSNPDKFMDVWKRSQVIAEMFGFGAD